MVGVALARAVGIGAGVVLALGAASACTVEDEATAPTAPTVADGTKPAVEEATVPTVRSGAACAAPYVTVEPAVASPGETVVVHGSGMKDGCADHMGMDEHGNVTHQEIETPLASIDVVYRVEGIEQVLATVDANDVGSFEAPVVIPPDSPLGPAEISAGPAWVEGVALEIVE